MRRNRIAPVVALFLSTLISCRPALPPSAQVPVKEEEKRAERGRRDAITPPPIAQPMATAEAGVNGVDGGVTGGVVGGVVGGYAMPQSVAPMRMLKPSNSAYSMADVEFNTEEYGRISENVFMLARETPRSTFSIDVDRASYSNVRRFITGGNLPPRDAVRIEELVNYFTYDYPEPAGTQPFSVSTDVTGCPWNDQNKLVRIGLQSRRVNVDELPPNNLTFLIDVSGSMQSPDKLPLVKASLAQLVDQLRPEDSVALVVYAGSAGLVLEPTRGSNKGAILGALERLEAGGSTAGGEGILLAYKVAKENFNPRGNNRVILASDGDFNVGVTSDGELEQLIEKKRKEGIYLTVLGFGTGNVKDSKMELLADKGNGNYAYIDSLFEARKTLVNEMGATLLTVAKDVKLQVEFNPNRVKAYRLIGYENRMLRDQDFKDDTKDAGEIGAGHSVTALYEIVPPEANVPGIDIDPLKYQAPALTDAAKSGELMTLKIRYKAPDQESSRELAYPIADAVRSIDAAPDDMRFAVAVAEFGMLLRKSEFAPGATFHEVIALAEGARGRDEEGYRAGFIVLARQAASLAGSEKIAVTR